MGKLCEICGGAVSVEAEYRYRRSGSAEPDKVATSLKRCSACGREGCPRCLRVVEERADDYFLEVYSCLECLEK